jgi:hypothetical protein
MISGRTTPSPLSTMVSSSESQKMRWYGFTKTITRPNNFRSKALPLGWEDAHALNPVLSGAWSSGING